MQSPTNIDIIPAGPGTADALAVVHAAVFPEPWSEASLARLVSADAARAWIALAGPGAPALGFVLAFAAAGEAEILSLAVLPAERRKGLARRLVGALVERLTQEAVDRLVLDVGASNWPALSLYRRLGFVEIGRRASYYSRPGQPPEDALMLALAL
jgi:ribosomal-protein-alanine N-acetyltransferase